MEKFERELAYDTLNETQKEYLKNKDDKTLINKAKSNVINSNFEKQREINIKKLKERGEYYG